MFGKITLGTAQWYPNSWTQDKYNNAIWKARRWNFLFNQQSMV